jgi:hypothetical protein
LEKQYGTEQPVENSKGQLSNPVCHNCSAANVVIGIQVLVMDMRSMYIFCKNALAPNVSLMNNRGNMLQFLLLLLQLGAMLAQGQQQPGCSAMYRDNGTPLLFGGVASSCSGSFCKSRETYWCEQDRILGGSGAFRQKRSTYLNFHDV